MLLSHHPPSQYCRTYKIFGIRLCARCLGIPIGILIGFILNPSMFWWILIVLPLPTFINFLIQELQWIKSYNLWKTILTIPLGVYLYILLESLIKLDLSTFIFMLLYIIIIEFIIAHILNKNNKLDQLIKEYEVGVYKIPYQEKSKLV